MSEPVYRVYKSGYPEESGVIDVYESEEAAEERKYIEEFKHDDVRVVEVEPKQSVREEDPFTYDLRLFVDGDKVSDTDREIETYETAYKFIKAIQNMLNGVEDPSVSIGKGPLTKSEVKQEFSELGDKRDKGEVNLEVVVVRHYDSGEEDLSEDVLKTDSIDKPSQLNWS